jgi:hypothetical protein
MIMTWKIVKTDPKNPASGDSNKIITPVFTAAFAAVFEPKAMKGSIDGKQRYSVTMIFPQGQDFGPLEAKIKQVAQQKWGDKAASILKRQSESDKRIFKDGSDMVEKKYAGFIDGAVYIKAANTQKPGLVKNVDGKLHHITEQSEFYSGCKAIASVTVHAWDNPIGKGVTLYLDNIQKISDGERLGGGRTSPDSDFETPMAADDMESLFG